MICTTSFISPPPYRMVTSLNWFCHMYSRNVSSTFTIVMADMVTFRVS